MVTIRDVARQSGVSVATVSRVLNNSALVSPDTREAVMKAVTQLAIDLMPTHKRWRRR
jgi:LacI family transcriptional regulator